MLGEQADRGEVLEVLVVGNNVDPPPSAYPTPIQKAYPILTDALFIGPANRRPRYSCIGSADQLDIPKSCYTYTDLMVLMMPF